MTIRQRRSKGYPHPTTDTPPCLSDDEPGLGRVIRQFLAQVPDHDAQVVSVFGVGRPPDVLEQLLLGDHPPWMPRQLRQHGVFLAGQRDFDIVEQHPAIRQIDRQRTEAQRRWLRLAYGHLAQ